MLKTVLYCNIHCLEKVKGKRCWMDWMDERQFDGEIPPIMIPAARRAQPLINGSGETPAEEFNLINSQVI